ncbi:hypothetical protein Tco_1072295 [Tanacetum coccineum]
MRKVPALLLAELERLDATDHFDSIVSDFVYDGESCTPSITAAAGEIFQSCMTEYLREQIRSHYTHKLFGQRAYHSNGSGFAVLIFESGRRFAEFFSKTILFWAASRAGVLQSTLGRVRDFSIPFLGFPLNKPNL